MFLHCATNPSFSSKLNTAGCNEDDRTFLFGILSERTILYNYSSSIDCCNWPGISCSNLTGRIISLDLSLLMKSNFHGADLFIPEPSLPSLDELASLQLDLDVVYFSKGFPSFIRSFPNLRHLYLFSYEEPGMVIFQGLGNLTKLETLEVTLYNTMGVVIQKELGNHTRLETLEVPLYNTMYTSTLSMLSRLCSLKRLVLNSVILSKATDWLHVVSNLPHLEHLDLSGCSLPNVIRHSQLNVNSSKSLAYLDLSHNNLESLSSWSWIFNHSSLISLLISDNQLVGSIPNRFGEMLSLSHLDLSNNRLEGRLPNSLGGLCRLRSLDVSGNHRLQGDLMSIFWSLSCANESLTTLSMHKNLFSGSLPDFTVFSSLSKLRLHSNRLNGSLPSYFTRSSSLAIFDVHNNQLTGPIPDLSVFRLLKVLQLRNNKLNGNVHPGLGQLAMLRHLDISSNSLIGDLGVSHLANLSSLRYFDISFNSLTLNVNSSWVPPFHLETIGLASCGLAYQFPEWLRTQTKYSRLDLSNTGLSDTIPFWFWNISSGATYIILSHNRLHGKLPTYFPFVFDMNPFIDMSSNFLEGTIPPFFSNAIYLNLSRNSFSGPVSFLCPSSSKLSIDLSHNNLSGELPDCSPEFASMSVLDLSNNSFSGQLPSSLANLSYLKSLHLRNNKFSGKLPLSLCNLTFLSYLDLGDNLFSGEIPGCLGHTLKKLVVLSLRNNSLSGSIPPQLCHPSIQILDLSMNNISGVIPKCLCKLQAMTQKKSLPVVMEDFNGTFSTIGATPYKDYVSLVLKGYLYNDANHLELVKSLNLSGNSLRGSIPGEISCLTGLISLNFSGNSLTGSITSKIGSLKSLESLDFSNNHLSGAIPSTIADLNFLGTLSLANNYFSGRIPTGTQIQGFNASAFAGNPGLCGEPLPNKCPGDGDGKGYSINEDDQNPKDYAFDLGLYISVVLGFITGFWVFCGVLVLKRSWRVAYFRAWIHAYDKLYVLVTLMLVRIRRRYLA
ncbi:receptor-like protein EIX2 [Silene latifolia]|uniref:receptor-like protein EIX2 n=1 Tax=Silene latifolia TaxID=37657 RepID=UPI003D76BA0A